MTNPNEQYDVVFANGRVIDPEPILMEYLMSELVVVR